MLSAQMPTICSVMVHAIMHNCLHESILLMDHAHLPTLHECPTACVQLIVCNTTACIASMVVHNMCTTSSNAVF
jgi:hypothetical protein